MKVIAPSLGHERHLADTSSLFGTDSSRRDAKLSN